jgi:hypothetical protein
MSDMDDRREMYERSVTRLAAVGLTPTFAVQYNDPVDGPLDAYFASDTPDRYAGEPLMSLADAYGDAYTTNTATLDAYHRLQLRLPGDPLLSSENI